MFLSLNIALTHARPDCCSHNITMEFFLNVITKFAKFSENIVITVKGLEHVIYRVRDQMLQQRPQDPCERIFKLSLIHASVIYQIL